MHSFEYICIRFLIHAMHTKGDLTQGGITGTLLRFTLPMIAGAMLQQCYNVADTLIVGRFVGPEALAAVGSAYTLMVFITSILLGLSMGSGTVVSLKFGAGDHYGMRKSIGASLIVIGLATIGLTAACFLLNDPILRLLQVPADVYPLMSTYLLIIYCGIVFTFLYNFYASMLRALGDSVTPLWFLAVSAVLNIVLDLVFILTFDWGVAGAAWATVISQAVSGLGIMAYTLRLRPELRIRRADIHIKRYILGEITQFSMLTSVQQSVMNFGILMVQGLVNSFGMHVMAAFAAAVKIDSFAYMPVQEFGNAFSTFIAQNFGAGQHDRIRRGVKVAIGVSTAFSVVVSAAVFIFAEELMMMFVSGGEDEIITVGAEYLRIEGSFYALIGLLFLLYGYYRAVRMPAMSVVLTVLSLGLRVALAYWLAAMPGIGVYGIWWAVPIGWFVADAVGIVYYARTKVKKH